ncbi:hypothetical protein DVH05_024536 [Phytophthora capsici]|nr:hypothetical protein DVH05_024536 [Phytophthora capsici]
MAAVLEQFENQLRTNVETHVRQVLTAHMEQVGAEIRLAIATQGQELRKMLQEDLAAFQKHITAQLDVAMASAEKKAKAMARRHRAEESLAHDSIRASLAKGISDCKADAATAAATRAEELFLSFKLHGCGASPSPQTSEAVDSLVYTLPRAILEPSPRSKLRLLEVSDDEEMSSSTEEEKSVFADNDFEAKRHSTKANSAADELLELLRAAQVSNRRSSAQVRLEKVRSSEQSKVSARAQARSKDLTRKSKQSQRSEPALKSRKQQKAPVSSYVGQVQDVVKRLSDGRKARKKEQAEEALKLAGFLLKAGK